MSSEIRTCRKCGVIGTIPIFYKTRKVVVCRNCDNLRKREARKADPSKGREANKRWRYANPKKFLAQRQRYRKKYAAKKAEQTKEYRKKYPEREYAYNVVEYALEKGRMQRPKECSMCQREAKLCAHHDDYSKPLDIKWVCGRCHKTLDSLRPHVDDYLKAKAAHEKQD